MSTTTQAEQFATVIRREIPSLAEDQVDELATILEQLVATFDPLQVYVFGSRARDDSRCDSDVDLMVVVEASAEPSYRRAQHAYRRIHRRFLFPMDILVWTREEFDRRAPNPATLPGTILREGRLLYAA